MTDGTFSSFAGLLHFACIHSHALELFMLFFAFAYNEWAGWHFQRKSEDFYDVWYISITFSRGRVKSIMIYHILISWCYINPLYFLEAEWRLRRLQRRSNTRPNLGTARASGGLQQVLHTYMFRKLSTSPSFLCLECALGVLVNNLSFIAVSARILLTSSPAMGDLTATTLMWPTTVRFWAHIDIKTLSNKLERKYDFQSLVVPHLLPGGVPGRAGGDAQMELHLPQPDHIRSGKQGLNWKKKLICHHCTAFNLRICGPDC